MKLKKILLSGLLFAGIMENGFSAGRPGEVPEITVLKVKQAPRIDGVLDDSSWYGAVYYKSIFAGYFGKSYSKIAKWQPLVYAVHDEEYLYIAYCCCMPHGSKLTAQSSKEKFSYGDDIVQVFIEPDLNLTYYYFSLNSSGISSEPEVDVATHIEDGRWTAEMRIPWRLLKTQGVNVGKKMGFNVIVNQTFQEGEGWLSWLPLFSSALTPERFAYIILGNEKYIPIKPEKLEEDNF